MNRKNITPVCNNSLVKKHVKSLRETFLHDSLFILRLNNFSDKNQHFHQAENHYL